MSDSITITREQFLGWANEHIESHNEGFDSLKSFVKKPKRREFWFVEPGPNTVWSPGLYANSTTNSLHVKEVLPGDIGPMSKEEAREWVTKAYDTTAYPNASKESTLCQELLKALGLSD